ncbi:MAG: MotA/TolQ/ExbB proton channel family protein, partial [Verrucomicrobiota bacterium]
MRRVLKNSLLTLVASAVPLAAQVESEFADLIKSAEGLIQQSLDEYQSFLKETSEEKLELVTEINALENEIVQLRKEGRESSSQIAQMKNDLDALQISIRNLDTQAQYSAGVLSEYLTNFESRIHLSEDQSYSQDLLAIRQELDQAGDDPANRIPVFFKALEAGLDRQEALLGGRRFTGRAITPDGGVKTGDIALIGPVAYFQADDASANGILRFNSGTIEPGLWPLQGEASQMLNQVFSQNQGYLPIDASLGKALTLKKAKGTLVQHIAKGGWVGYTILLLGASSILISLLKIFDLRGSRIDDPGDISAIAKLSLENQAEANTAVSRISGPTKSIITAGIEFAKADSETQYEAMEAVILKNQPRLERFLPFLATTAAVAPLMGLLGTVVGMIKTFTLIEVFGTGDAKSLSSGISEALITTELGLIVAIPALIFHGIFSRIMRSRIGSMEQVASDFGRHLASERTAAQ